MDSGDGRLFSLKRVLLSQLEWLTGGECKAGMHEVAVSEQTLQAVERARREGRSLWRVSSTVSLQVPVVRCLPLFVVLVDYCACFDKWVLSDHGCLETGRL